MQFLNHTYSILVLFGHRILVPLKYFIFLYFLNQNAHTAPLLKDSDILKFPDKITLENCIKNYFNQTLLTPFKNWFTLSKDSHTHNTRWSKIVWKFLFTKLKYMKDNLLILVQSTFGISHKEFTKLCLISFL